MQKKLIWSIAALLLLPLGAQAGRQMCGNQEVPASARTCPDGSSPMFIADEIKAYVPPQAERYVPPQPEQYVPPRAEQYVPPRAERYVPPQPAREAVQAPPRRPRGQRNNEASSARPAASAAAHLDYYFGVWRTAIPGAVWTSPSGYRGVEWLHVSTGVSAGDLIIRPNGTYVWNSYGGKAGRWVDGDAEYPIVLIDTVENRRWKVGADPRHTGGRDIMVWDGNSIYYDGRK